MKAQLKAGSALHFEPGLAASLSASPAAAKADHGAPLATARPVLLGVAIGLALTVLAVFLGLLFTAATFGYSLGGLL